MGLYDYTFYDLVNRNAIVHGARICWQEIDDGRTLSFIEYKKQVDRLAAGLCKAGIGKEDRIGVLGKNSLEFFLLYGAAAALGAIVLPVNWRLSADEVCYNLNDCQPKVLFADAEYQAMLEQKRSELPSVGAVYNLKGDLGEAARFGDLLETAGGFVQEGEVESTDGFVIIHTAAVAGRPRGALLSHANVLSANMHFCYSMGIGPQDVHLNLLPLFHVAGLFMTTSSFHAGALNVNMSRFEAKSAAKIIQEQRVGLLFDFPPILDSLLKAAEDRFDLTSLRAVVGLGTPEVIERYEKETRGSYYAMYGQTETSCLTTMGRYRDRPGSAGQPLMLAEVRLVDEHDKQVPSGAVGEIAVRGPMVFKGYWGLPEDNAYTFREGWHHTGDLGRFDADGYLFYAGRKAEKELIKPGGENVYPAEVEKVILLHPAIARTAVIGVPDPKWKEGIKAVCELRGGQTLTAAELIRFVGERIASFKKPQYVEFVEALPVRQDGSIDREQVKFLYGER